jgi:putative chitinase
MCLVGSVGVAGRNARDDVKTIQILLNMNLGKLIPLAPLGVDGRIGSNTNAAIAEFQRRVVGQAKPDGRIDPRGATLRALQEGIDPLFTREKLQGIMIRADGPTVATFLTPLISTMANNFIDSPLRMAHFLAQLAHESGDLRYTEEIASGQAYEGRADLGNTQPGDGKRFKGRGLIQLTGRNNYKAYGDDRGKDFTTDATAPLIASDAMLSADVSGWFWDSRGLNDLADLDDVNAVTKKINGGFNGLNDRKVRLARAKFFLQCD